MHPFGGSFLPGARPLIGRDRDNGTGFFRVGFRQGERDQQKRKNSLGEIIPVVDPEPVASVGDGNKGVIRPVL